MTRILKKWIIMNHHCDIISFDSLEFLLSSVLFILLFAFFRLHNNVKMKIYSSQNNNWLWDDEDDEILFEFFHFTITFTISTWFFNNNKEHYIIVNLFPSWHFYFLFFYFFVSFVPFYFWIFISVLKRGLFYWAIYYTYYPTWMILLILRLVLRPNRIKMIPEREQIESTNSLNALS